MAAFQPLSWQSTFSGNQVGGELTINALRGHLAEHGVGSPQGWARIGQLDAALEDAARSLPEAVVELRRLLLGRITALAI
ncbi:MAG: hypothetical protein OXU74_10630 [Gemmatimonadota bacterium]|nr:hypothetical protein [Gemmatimonadota bacterium]